MVLDHLRIVDEGMAQIIETLTDNRLFGQEVRIQDVNAKSSERSRHDRPVSQSRGRL
jgi:hypothetical protein